MDSDLRNRIERAWRECKDWIVAFDGSPTITLLVNLPVEALYPALQTIARQSENFRFTRIPAGRVEAPQFIPLEAFPGELARLQKDEIAELSANFAVRAEDFDLDLHAIVHPVAEGKAALELVWWSDQVFSEETDDIAQFRSLAQYFVALQKLFASPQVFIGKESGLDPLGNAEDWVEI